MKKKALLKNIIMKILSKSTQGVLYYDKKTKVITELTITDGRLILGLPILGEVEGEQKQILHIAEFNNNDNTFIVTYHKGLRFLKQIVGFNKNQNVIITKNHQIMTKSKSILDYLLFSRNTV